MARMRYPEQALELLKKEDPETQVTLNFIRSLLAGNAIPYVKIGRRRLLNYDALVEYLANGSTREEMAPLGAIRRVKA
ncbi:MAG: hypothetical protein ACRKFN_10555 [Desulfitobacterium sp.]